MGKGGTKFEPNAIGQRGSGFKSYSQKDRKKDLEEYQKTGRHPELEAAEKRRAADTLLALPDPETSRPRTYLQFSAGGAVLGRVVFEVFQDVTALAARTFINRCSRGSTSTMQDGAVHKVLPGLGIFFGHSPRYRGEAAVLKAVGGLRHADPHVVSIKPDGTEVVVSLSRSATLDTSHLVVGRVQLGHEVLDKIVALGTDPHDVPAVRVTITACGLANSKGEVEQDSEEAAAEARRNETPEQTAARLKRESQAAHSSIREALQTGLKRKEPEEAAAAAGSQTAAAPPAASKPKLAAGLYDVLGGSSASDSSSDET